ncbi:MAG: electron transfer flavoprotein subunit beta/FixA family protein [Actinobacteria bacterium]|nr:electron transfer flavoprotein subunit beta/FixA family protein [Actinomycetota bacterium]MCG2798319.1 electron transfer flavoprotein subunit beta/FixA family protein [Cellulomonas sp.]
MKIAVLVKQVPDTWDPRRLDPSTYRADRTGGEQVVDEIDERAVEVALAHRDRVGQTEVVVVTMGPDGARDVLRRMLAMGADRAVHVLDDALAGADLVRTAEALAAVLVAEAPDLVVAGNESTDGRGGVLPAMLAEHLGLALLSGLTSIEVDGTRVSGTRTNEAGTAHVHAQLPAVVSITEQLPEARVAGLRGIMAAKRKPVARFTANDLGLAPSGATTRVLTAAPRPPRTAGERLTDDGTAARRLADFLADRHLI